MNHHAIQLYDYHIWANNRFFERLKELPYSVYTQEIQSVFPSMAETIVHMYTTDTIYLGVIREKNMDEIQASIIQAQEKIKGKGPEEMGALYTELAEQYKAFFNSQEDMNKPIAPEHPAYGRLETQLSEIIQHVVNHGTYHRGNLTAMLRQQGYPSVPTDYIFYLYHLPTENPHL
ncbi:putative damage-inducible protein DinB [Lederbergia galactosidilyticus]|uniref:DinB family protein n=1 Tax=Lederbergia galactosidilytica TaxID=217031 RepID=UPI001AE165D6|nr:DinB family protein [Lederbergia galactosidilytica]MBP1916329.1 putative damage-inducible protein DinB [Lederbergia galactosidilytica]